MEHPADGTLLGLGSEPLPTVHGDFTAHVFQDLATGTPALAVTCGDPAGAAPLLARVHSSCITSEAYGGCDCDCAEQLDGALARIARARRGVVFYLIQEGRGAGFMAKARDRMLVQASGNRLTTFEAYAHLGIGRDTRRYDAVGAMARLLGVRAPLVLLTNNPEKTGALAGAGLSIAGTAALPPGVSPFNRHYLAAKREAGHTFAAADATPAAALPEPVVAFAPHTLDGARHLVCAGSYLLPVRLAPPAWFRVHAYFDTAAGVERVVLTHGEPGAGRPSLVRLEHDTLRERFPLREPRLARRWRAAAERIAAHGAGVVLFAHARGFAAAAAAAPDTAAALIAAHVGGAGARLLVAAGEEPETAPVTVALARQGVALAPPCPLAA